MKVKLIASLSPTTRTGFCANCTPPPSIAAIPISFRAASGEGPGLRVSILPEDGSQLITGMNPAIRPAGEDDHELDQFNRPFMLLRREAKDRPSNFVSVIEPHQEKPFLTSIERSIRLSDGAIAVRVAIGDRTDIIVIGAQAGVAIPAGRHAVTFRGDYGVMSLRGAAVEYAFSLGEGMDESSITLIRPARVVCRFKQLKRVCWSWPPPVCQFPKRTTSFASSPPMAGSTLTRWLPKLENRGDQLWLTVGEGPGFQFDSKKQHLQFASFPQREHSGAVRVEWTTRAER